MRLAIPRPASLLDGLVSEGNGTACRVVMSDDVPPVYPYGSPPWILQNESSGEKPVALKVYERSDVDGTDDTGQQLRDLAVADGRVDVLRLLIARGADVRYPTQCLDEAVTHGQADVVELILDAQSDEWTGLDMPRWLRDRTLLMQAAYLGHVDVVRVLLRRGARHDKKDYYGHTAAVIARAELYRSPPEAAALLAEVITAGGWRKYELNGLHRLFALRALCSQGRAWCYDPILSRIFPDNLVCRPKVQGQKERRTWSVLFDKYVFWRVISFWLPLSTNKRTPVRGPGLGSLAAALQESEEERDEDEAYYDSEADQVYDTESEDGF